MYSPIWQPHAFQKRSLTTSPWDRLRLEMVRGRTTWRGRGTTFSSLHCVIWVPWNKATWGTVKTSIKWRSTLCSLEVRALSGIPGWDLSFEDIFSVFYPISVQYKMRKWYWDSNILMVGFWHKTFFPPILFLIYWAHWTDIMPTIILNPLIFYDSS